MSSGTLKSRFMKSAKELLVMWMGDRQRKKHVEMRSSFPTSGSACTQLPKESLFWGVLLNENGNLPCFEGLN